MVKLLVFLIVIFNISYAYDRKEYGGWERNKYTGCNTRQEILITSFVKINQRLSKCKIEGEWEDFFTGKILNDAKKIDIDHILSVSEFDSKCRTKEMEFKDLRKFYNDRENLVITSKKENQRKSNKSKDEYSAMIKDEIRREAYVKKYDLIHKKYNCK